MALTKEQWKDRASRMERERDATWHQVKVLTAELANAMRERDALAEALRNLTRTVELVAGNEPTAGRSGSPWNAVRNDVNHANTALAIMDERREG